MIIKCKKCGSILESKSKNDFKQCNCGSIFIDGGNEYCRLGYPHGKFENWIEYIDNVGAPQ